ncbi:MAG: pilin [Candidatus Magasanikbacteria bacterium]
MSRLKNFLYISVIPALAGVLAPSSALAQTPPRDNPAPDPVQGVTVSGFIGLLEQILGWVYTIFFIAAAGAFLYSAFLYLTAAGDEEQVEDAKNALIYGIVGVAVALLAFAIDGFVDNLLSEGISS